MQTYNFHHLAQKSTLRRLLLQCFFVFVFLPGLIHAAEMGDPISYHESGELTDIESPDTVIINERGYDVDPSVLVINVTGRPTSLDKLNLPTLVNFKYCYMESAQNTMSPVIVYIEEAIEKERSM